MLITFCVGKCTYRTFMSKVIILCRLLICMLFRSCSTSFEFLVAYVYGSFISWLIFLLKIFGKLIRWCLYIIYCGSDGFVFFMCFDKGVEFWCHRFFFVPGIFVGFCLLLCYICALFVKCVFEMILLELYSCVLFDFLV
jgi:hypothetical protein